MNNLVADDEGIWEVKCKYCDSEKRVEQSGIEKRLAESELVRDSWHWVLFDVSSPGDTTTRIPVLLCHDCHSKHHGEGSFTDL